MSLKQGNMPVDKNEKDYSRVERINLNDKSEMEYWSKRLGISESHLMKIALEVSPDITELQEFLKGYKS